MKYFISTILLFLATMSNAQPWSSEYLDELYIQELIDRGAKVVQVEEAPEIEPEPELPALGDLECRTVIVTEFSQAFECEHIDAGIDNEYGRFTIQQVREDGSHVRIFASEWSKAIGIRLQPSEYVFAVTFIDRYQRRIFRIFPVSDLVGTRT